MKAQLSYMILHLHESGNFREQAIEYRKRFTQLHADIQEAFKTRLREANRNIWACDPSDYHGSSAFPSNFPAHDKINLLNSFKRNILI